MKEFLTYGLVLFFIVAIACGILAMVNEKTAPIIKMNRAEAETKARQDVFPEGFRFRHIEAKSLTYFEVFDIDDQLLGYTFIASGKGYSGKIYTMVGIHHDMSINRIKVIEHTETPGLGANCTKEDFLNRFPNLKKTDLRVNKDGGKIESITGATITSRTIVNSIKEYIELLKETLDENSDNNDDVPIANLTMTLEEIV